MTAPPRLNRNFGSTKNIMIRANELENNTQACKTVPDLFPAAHSGARLLQRPLMGLLWSLYTVKHVHLSGLQALALCHSIFNIASQEFATAFTALYRSHSLWTLPGLGMPHQLIFHICVVQTYVKFMAKATGKDPVEVRKDVGRNRYFSATQVNWACTSAVTSHA